MLSCTPLWEPSLKCKQSHHKGRRRQIEVSFSLSVKLGGQTFSEKLNSSFSILELVANSNKGYQQQLYN